MSTFQTTLDYINRLVYAPNQLITMTTQKERQNPDHAAGTFELSTELNAKSIRFIVAKQRPTKVEHLVTFWEKDVNDTNQPYHFDEAPDLLVITVFRNDSLFGQFFSKRYPS